VTALIAWPSFHPRWKQRELGLTRRTRLDRKCTTGAAKRRWIGTKPWLMLPFLSTSAAVGETLSTAAVSTNGSEDWPASFRSRHCPITLVLAHLREFAKMSGNSWRLLGLPFAARSKP
jgi:hypothetical protein